jgi:flotillin
MGGFEMIAIGVAVLVVFAVLSSMFVSIFQKCPPNTALIVFGAGGKEPRVVKGGGTYVLPLIQAARPLSLEVMTIDVKSASPIITRNGVPVFVEGVAQVKVDGDDDSIRTAAEQFLSKDTQEIMSIAHETLIGHLRGIVGTMEVEELIQSTESFSRKVLEITIPDLHKMGLTIVSFTIKEIRDSVGYLEQLGRKQAAETKQRADIGVAEATKTTEVAKAEALRATQLAQSNALRETTIAKANSERDAKIAQAHATQEAETATLENAGKLAEKQRDLSVKQSEYAAEIAQKKAYADIAGEIVKAQNTQKLIEEQQKIRIVEAQKNVELQAVEVQKRQVMLEAEVTKPAEAEQQRTRINAQAEQEKRKILAQADAESVKLRAIGDAEALRIKALAEAEATRAQGLAMAESKKAQGLAEAAIIAAKGDAEAQAMVKRAEAYKLYNEAAIASMIIEKLPQIVEAAAAPLSKIGQVTVVSTGGDSLGGNRLTQEVVNAATQSLAMVKGLTGIDLVASLGKHLNAIPSNGGSTLTAGETAAKAVIEAQARPAASTQQQSAPAPVVTTLPPRPQT